MRYSEWLGPDYLDYWLFGILTDKAMSRIPQTKTKVRERESSFLLIRASLGTQGEQICVWILSIYNNIQLSEKTYLFQIRTL